MTPSNPTSMSMTTSTSAIAEAKSTEVTVWNPALKDSIGFNGEVVAWSHSFGLYNLGHGQRVFSPGMRMFWQMDGLSPFGAGGTNGYQYGRNNPILYLDPTGHISWQGGVSIFLALFSFLVSLISFGIGFAGAAAAVGALAAISESFTSAIVTTLAGVSAGLGIGSVVERDRGNVELADRLNIASAITGAMSMGTGVSELDFLVAIPAVVMADALTRPGAATPTISAASDRSNEMGQVTEGESSDPASMAGASDSVPRAVPATGQSEAAHSLSRLLSAVTLKGLRSPESVAADRLHARPGHPDRYAEANLPSPSPYIRSAEQA